MDLELTNVPENPKPGDKYIDEDGREWVCSADGSRWLEFKRNPDGSINTGLTNYDLNKMVVSQLSSKVTNGQLKEYKELLKDFGGQDEVFMLLCNDIHYYTVIQHVGGRENAQFHNVVIELLQDNGEIKLIDWSDETHTAVECWVQKDDITYMFMLFPYSWGIVECE